MEISENSIQEKNEIQRTEKATEQDKNDEEIDIHKYSEPYMKSIKRSDVFEEPHVKKSRKKKHCNWMKSNSDTYCPKFLQAYRHQKTFDYLKKYITDKPSAPDLPQECDQGILPR